MSHQKIKVSETILISLLVAGGAALFPTASTAAVQNQTTPYSSFKSQLDISADKGSTYLSFMEKDVKPQLDSYKDDILQAQQGGNYRGAVLSLLSQGEGVAIRIDANNYTLNVGYLTGENSDDVKSGRSFGVGPTGRQSDPSDVFYLTELEKYLQGEPHPETFYRALMETLTDCDTSLWSSLSTDGQTVATDFLAIYTAESDRHIMVHLQPGAHPWEIDLAAATFVSLLDVKTGIIMKSGQLVQGQITDWWAQGKSGSGIGETRSDRELLQKKISDFERSRNPDLVSAIEKIIGQRQDGDVIQGTLEFLNNPSAPDSLGSQASELTDAVVKLLVQVGEDSNEIVQSQ